jgi:hypothetical protein
MKDKIMSLLIFKLQRKVKEYMTLEITVETCNYKNNRISRSSFSYLSFMLKLALANIMLTIYAYTTSSVTKGLFAYRFS